jgi:hypothetical protein
MAFLGPTAGLAGMPLMPLPPPRVSKPGNQGKSLDALMDAVAQIRQQNGDVTASETEDAGGSGDALRSPSKRRRKATPAAAATAQHERQRLERDAPLVEGIEQQQGGERGEQGAIGAGAAGAAADAVHASGGVISELLAQQVVEGLKGVLHQQQKQQLVTGAGGEASSAGAGDQLMSGGVDKEAEACAMTTDVGGAGSSQPTEEGREVIGSSEEQPQQQQANAPLLHSTEPYAQAAAC